MPRCPPQGRFWGLSRSGVEFGRLPLVTHSGNVARTKGEPTPRLEASVGAARSLIALRVILDAAVERIGGPNLPRIRPNHQSIPLRGVEIDRTIKVKLSKTKGRLRPAIESGLSRRPKCKCGPSEGPVQVQRTSRRGGLDDLLQERARCSACVLDCMGRDSTHRYRLIRGLLNASDARTSYESVFQSCAFAHDSKS